MARLMLSCGVRSGIVPLLLAFSGLISTSVFADQVIRVMAANTSSGNNQSYDPGHGNRIFQGLDPDIALVQEMNVTLNGSKNSPATYQSWVNTNFGAGFHYHVETGKSIPNGIVSRYPFINTGVWEDTQMPDREFVWARIDLPGDMNLLAISVHLSSGGGSSVRNTQAGNLRSLIQANKLATDHVVIGGDFNTDNRTESCLSTLSSVVVTGSPWPVDQDGTGGTNASRAKPYDWVAPGSSLAALSTPLVIGSNTFANGLVFDSREYTPLSAVSPVQSGDSGATGMQHMAVMRAFLIPTNEAPVIAQGSAVPVTLSKNNSPVAFSRSLNATDVDGDSLTWSILTPASHGTAGIVAPASGGTVSLSYSPAANYTGSDSFVVRVSDGQGGTDAITVNLTIQEPPNTLPVISGMDPVNVTVSENNHPTAFALALLASDADSDPLSWSISSPAAHGSAAVVAPATGGSVAISYQPVTGYTGGDSFVVRVADGRGGSDFVTVNLTVEAASAYDRWTYDSFPALVSGSEASVWGDGADPDGDGYTNLEEFAHGLNPNAEDFAPNLLSCSRGAAGNDILLSYMLRMDGEAPALDYTVQGAEDLAGTWAALPPESYHVLGEDELGGGFRKRSIRLDEEVGATAKFFRLVISR